MDSTYPFVVNLEPLDIDIETDDIIINTRSFYDDGEEGMEHDFADEIEDAKEDDKGVIDPTQYF
ncbi:hypothetical protein ACYCS5_28225 [Paenibacillus sp. SEL3]|nr:hypothetical protein CG775_08815 [Paenibacillus polymyxa]